MSIEDALNAFDFLEVEDQQDDEEEFIDGYKSHKQQHHKTNATDDAFWNYSAPDSSRTTDSGIDCSHHLQLHDVTSHDSCTDQPAVSCGNPQIDRVAVWHLMYCGRLLESLHVAPQVLKYREGVTMEKLKRQSDIVKNLARIATAYSNRAIDLAAG